MKAQGTTTQRLAQLWDRLVEKDGALKRRFEDTQTQSSWLQLVIPHSLREEILQELHAGVLGGHLGEDKTLLKIRERFYWPGLQLSVRDWCHTCEPCVTRKTAPKRNHAPLQMIRAGYPMQVVAVDMMGPLPESENGNSYVLVAGNYFTKWMEAYAIPDQEATTVAQKMVDEMFCRFSTPEQLHSDNGAQFESKLMKEICKTLHIKKTRTTPYQPQCNGLVECFNRMLLNMLATTTREHPLKWDSHIWKVCIAYNTSVHSSTGFTPFYLMFGRQAKLPIDLMYGPHDTSERPVTEYARQHVRVSTMPIIWQGKDLEQATNAVKTTTRKFTDRLTHRDDLSGCIPPGHSRKLHHLWIGPYKVIE